MRTKMVTEMNVAAHTLYLNTQFHLWICSRCNNAFWEDAPLLALDVPCELLRKIFVEDYKELLKEIDDLRQQVVDLKATLLITRQFHSPQPPLGTN